MTRHLTLFTLALAVAPLACGTNPGVDVVDLDASIDAGAEAGADVPADVAVTEVTADAEPDVGADADPADALTDAADVRPLARSPLATCEPAIAWSTTANAQWMEPAIFSVSQNGGLIWAGHHDNWSAVLFRVADGEVMARPYDAPAMAIDPAWSRRAYVSNEGELLVGPVAVTSDAAPPVVVPPQADGYYSWRAGAWNADGTELIAAGCTQDDQLQLSRWRFTPAPERTALLAEAPLPQTENWYCRNHQSRPLMQRTRDGRVFFASPLSPEVWRWDPDTGAVDAVMETGPVAEENPPWWAADVFTLEVSPDGSTLAVVGADGWLTMLATDTFDVLHTSPIDSNMLNEMTFAPHVWVSPIAFAPDSQTFAGLGLTEEGVAAVQIRDVRSGEVLSELPLPQGDPEPLGGMPNALAQLTFADDGNTVFALAMHGVTAIACTGHAPGNPPMNSMIEVTLDGPVTVGVHAPERFSVALEGAEGAPIVRFSIDDAPYFAGFEHFADLTFDRGEHAVEVFVEDGRRQGYATLRVTAR